MVRYRCMAFAFVLFANVVAAAVPSDTAELDRHPTGTSTTRRLRRPAGGTEPTNVIAPSDLRASLTKRTLQGGEGGFDQNDLIQSADSLF